MLPLKSSTTASAQRAAQPLRGANKQWVQEHVNYALAKEGLHNLSHRLMESISERRRKHEKLMIQAASGVDLTDDEREFMKEEVAMSEKRKAGPYGKLWLENKKGEPPFKYITKMRFGGE